ncbi:hypothetical protein Hanom_Chr05g00432491 [Helianthus anomalus]
MDRVVSKPRVWSERAIVLHHFFETSVGNFEFLCAWFVFDEEETCELNLMITQIGVFMRLKNITIYG